MDKFLMSSPQLLQPFPDEDSEQVYDYEYDVADFLYDVDTLPPRTHSKHFSVDGRQFDRPFDARQQDTKPFDGPPYDGRVYEARTPDGLLAPFLLNAGSRFNFSHLRNVLLDAARYNHVTNGAGHNEPDTGNGPNGTGAPGTVGLQARGGGATARNSVGPSANGALSRNASLVRGGGDGGENSAFGAYLGDGMHSQNLPMASDLPDVADMHSSIHSLHDLHDLDSINNIHNIASMAGISASNSAQYLAAFANANANTNANAYTSSGPPAHLRTHSTVSASAFVPSHAHRVSQSADPPSGTFTHLVSLLTLHLGGSMPALLLLALNALLLDLPYLAMALTTPARRRKCLVLSATYATPMRGVPPLPGLKVGKTPKTHRRTRLKAAGKLLDAFEALDSPGLDYDVATPAKRPAPQYFTPVLGFGALLDAGPRLRRNDTLDLIKIEDQDDDACKQLRKARLFTAGTSHTYGAYTNFAMSLAPHFTLSEAAGDAGGEQTGLDGVNGPGMNGGLGGLNGGARGNGSGNGNAQGSAFAAQLGRFRKSASIDLLLPELVASDRSTLKSYPASIDLAAITNSGVTATPHPAGGLLPPIAATRMRGVSPLRASTTYPTPSQIHESSTTVEIAKFAEEILKSDSKRPIVVQPDEDEVDPKKKHKCPLCLARFQRPEHVKRHLKSHSTEKPFQCDVPSCGRRFNRKDNLKAHLKKIHKKAA